MKNLLDALTKWCIETAKNKRATPAMLEALPKIAQLCFDYSSVIPSSNSAGSRKSIENLSDEERAKLEAFFMEIIGR